MWAPGHDICSHPHSHIQVGDINGDGRMDVVCHHHTGAISISPADVTGHLLPATRHLPHRQQVDTQWCAGENSTLLLGTYVCLSLGEEV